MSEIRWSDEDKGKRERERKHAMIRTVSLE